jgi:hypothetical protein
LPFQKNRSGNINCIFKNDKCFLKWRAPAFDCLIL